MRLRGIICCPTRSRRCGFLYSCRTVYIILFLSAPSGIEEDDDDDDDAVTRWTYNNSGTSAQPEGQRGKV